jgi:putative transposase
VESIQAPEDRLAKLSEQDLARLERRRQLISELAKLYRPSRLASESVEKELGLSARTVRRLVYQFRHGGQTTTTLVAKGVGRRRGSRTLNPTIEKVIRDVLERTYSHKQKCTLSHAYRQICLVCQEHSLKPPSLKSVHARLSDLDPIAVARRRHGEKAAQVLKPVTGHAPVAEYPLHIVQIDHTKMDVILVDGVHRKPVGRPYVTFAIDLFSRCIAGFYVSYEAPSATTVALCLRNIAENKEVMLRQYGIAGSWPITGIPAVLHLDNAAEFHGRALQQGCTLHGIELRFRPPGRPWYGGTIERRIKQFMQLAHNELPGTTYSNPQDRGEYDSERLALLTLKEVEDWLALAILEYHAVVQDGIGEPPFERLRFALDAGHAPRTVSDLKAFSIDFMPVVTRKLRRDGFHIDHLIYYDTKLDYYIARRNKFADGFEIRRDPRNLGFIWVRRPDGSGYMEVSQRDISQPNIMLFEHKAALRELRERNVRNINPDLIMRTVKARRAVIQRATQTSKRARRDAERLQNRGPALVSPPPSPAPPLAIEEGVILPFDDLEVRF